MQRAQYAKQDNPLALTLDLKNVPLEMYQARNAVDIAKSRQAAKYAPEILAKAEASLKMAENSLDRKANKKETISTARQAIQLSEDARALSTQRQDDERIAAEKAAAAAKAKADSEAKAAAEAAEAKRVADAAAAAARASAQAEARRQAELTAAREAQMRAESAAAAAKAKAEADILAARGQAARAEAERAKADADRAKADAERASKATEALRAQLLAQFSRILETRDTPRGLVVNMADVLFDTGKFNLRPPTREKLARLAGIVLAHPGLNLEVEGHTDSTGSDELNQKLSEQRAETTRAFLMDQGLQAEHITSKGFCKTMPVADNATAAGRQQNRRVEIIVSGEVIGARIGAR
ncbi:MAG TPA: OmpA family protein [Paludibaculum sp.]|jgi:outer membrane protein OmpA-like peptidoglycan-associated protein